MFLGSYVIILVLVIFPCTLFVTYSLAVTSHHVKPIWPFVSYVGNRPLESCIFSLALSICSALFVVIVVLRHVQMCDVIEKSESDEKFFRKVTKLNTSSTVLGVMGAFGLSTTASFQQRNFVLIHFIGVFLCTYFTFIYFSIQTYLTFKLPSQLTKRCIKILRLIAVVGSGLILACAPIMIVWGFIIHPHNVRWVSSYQRQDGIYLEGAFLEWILLIFYFLFIASLYEDLKKISLTSDQIILLE